jgi:asparagine synthetase B (glutamine-hydrolysing)
MATLTTKLTLQSSNATSDALNVSVSDVLTVTYPLQGVSRIGIAVSGGSDTTLVASSASNKYVYVKHTGYQSDGTTATDNEVVIDFGTTDSIRLSSEEFTFFPAKASTAITAVSNHTSTILVEYGYWTKG